MTHPRLSQRIADEQGWVLISATILTLIMLSIGLVAAGLIDNSTRRSREQRERESALNVDEGVLYAQSLVMQTAWPSAAATDPLTGNPQYYPGTCASTGPADRRCPNAESLVAANSSTPDSAVFGNVDEIQDVTWVTKVRDNGGALATAYDPDEADDLQPGCTVPGDVVPATACTYDANRDRELWVQSQAIVRGKPRNVVARLRLEQLSESVPKAAVTSGAVKVTNKGNHGGTAIIDATGSQVYVRCADPASKSCADYESGQIKPGAPQSDASAPNLMSADQLQRFKARAIIDGTYFSGCPGENGQGYDLSGQVVWVEGCVNPPNLANKVPTTACGPALPTGLDPDCVNSETEPGVLIWHCGRADLSGGWTYRGLLYVVNNSDGTCAASMPARGDGTCSSSPNTDVARDAITTNGGFGVWGVVAVDGQACLKLGSNGIQVSYDGSIFDAVESYGTVGLVQNTWRELNPKDF
jgi:Tfp pilus assembly protein PilX